MTRRRGPITPDSVARRVVHNGGQPEEDAVVVEAPLEIRVDGETLSVTMRTPGHDQALAVGFLFAEGVICSRDDFSRAEHACVEGEGGACNVVDVQLNSSAPGNAGGRPAVRRGTLSTAACGVCGRLTIRDLLEICRPQPVVPTVGQGVLARATAELDNNQSDFATTGGSHAAAILDTNGVVLSAHEDIGRHNAVDKVVGALVTSGSVRRPPEDTDEPRPAILVVSGRVSFEIVQKCAVAGVPVVAGVSAASSLAIDLADEMGVTLAAFARNGRFNLYTHPQRVIGS